MKELFGLYFDWVTATVGPIVSQIPYGLGHSWVFWIVVWFVLVDPPILIGIFANRALAKRYSDILGEVGAFPPGSISARRIVRLSRIAANRLTDSSSRDGLSSIKRWLWFGYVWQVSFWISFVLVISYLVARSPQ